MTAAATKRVELAAGGAMSRDHDGYQREKIAIYQAALAAAGGDRQRVSREGQLALADMLEDLDGLLRLKIREQLLRRFGRVPEDLFEECLAEARVACIEAAPTFDPARGRKVSGWFLEPRCGGQAFTAIRATIQRATRAEELTNGQEAVLRVAHGVIADLLATGVVASSEQILEETTSRCRRYAIGKVYERWERDGRTPPPASDADAWAALAKEATPAAVARMNKDGITSALRDLWDLIATADHAVPLDPDAIDDRGRGSVAGACSEQVLGPDTADAARVAVVGMSEADREVVWAHLIGDGSSPTRESGQGGQTTASLRKSRARVSALLGDAHARLGAPHAHFAALAPSLDLQFESPADRPAPTSTPSLVAAVRLASLTP